MPLDSQTYLRNNGWQGHGTALREGALARPLSIPQKRTLAGVGKDRDEAFPFWDHVFAAASSAIQIKVGSDDESDSESTPRPSLRLTQTGIISNKRPPTGTPAESSHTSPEPSAHPQSVMSIAKRAAARKNLYSRFFKGPVLGPDVIEKEMVMTEVMSMEEKVHAGHEELREGLEHAHVVHHVEEGKASGEVKSKKRKREGMEGGEAKDDGRKKRSKEEKEQRRMEKVKRRAEKEARRAAKASAAPSASTTRSASDEPGEGDEKAARRKTKAERRKTRAEASGVDDKEKRRPEKEERKAKRPVKEAEKPVEEDKVAKKKRKADAASIPASTEETDKSERKKKRRRRESAEEEPSAKQKSKKRLEKSTV